MSKGNTFENDVLEKTFKGTDFPWDANTDLYISLHTSDPGGAGAQDTSEANYTSYERVAVARSSLGWTVNGNQAVNASLLQFPQCTGGSNTITHVAVGTAARGSGRLLYSGPLSATLFVSNGIQPQIAAGSFTITED